MTWKELAKDNELAAAEMFIEHRWRSCISRAYYAAYSALTDRLLYHGITMPAGQSNPPHGKVPNLIRFNLVSLSHPLRMQMAGAVSRLYQLRLMADYMPQVIVDEGEARNALGYMVQTFRCLGR